MNQNQKTRLKNILIGGSVLGLSAFLANSAWAISAETGETNELTIAPEANQILDSKEEVPTELNETITSSEKVFETYTTLAVAENAQKEETFEQAFAVAREEIGPGGLFEWKGNYYGTYYKEEWEGLSDSAKTAFVNGVMEEGKITDAPEIIDTHQAADMVFNHNISFEEAFAEARESFGAGSVFEWNGNSYTTYYKEEWEGLSSDAKASFAHTEHSDQYFVSNNGADSRANNIIDTEEMVAEMIVDATPFRPDENANIIIEEDIEGASEMIVTTEEESHLKVDAAANLIIEDGVDNEAEADHLIAIDDHANAVPIIEEIPHNDDMFEDAFADILD